MGALLCCAAGAGERQGDACPTRVGQARRRIVEALSTHRLACPTRVGQEGRRWDGAGTALSEVKS